MFKIYSTLFCLVFTSIQVHAQNMIYYKNNKVDHWKVTEINPEYIKGTDGDNKVAYSTTASNVLFIFNDLGHFLVMPKLYGKNPNSEVYIRNFLQKISNNFHRSDKIITVQNQIITCNYDTMINNKIVYTADNKQGKLSKSDVAVIMYRNGEHKFFASVDRVYKVLSSIQDSYNKQAFSTDDGKITTGKAGEGTNEVAKKELDSLTLLKLQIRALQNIQELGTYIQFICIKESDPDDIAKTITQALTLFISDAKIEVSSLNRAEVQRFKVKEYLTRLGDLKYEKVIIQWSKIQYSSEIRKGADGFYYGTIHFEQRFIGLSGDKKVYEDLTRKTVEIILKSYEKKRGGEITIEWDVFLGDIGIAETALPQ